MCVYYGLLTFQILKLEHVVSVYLRTLPEVVYKRMQRRNRPEERTVELEYLVDLHEYHEKWLMEKKFNISCSLLVIDVNTDLSDNQLVDLYKTYEKNILGKLPVLCS